MLSGFLFPINSMPDVLRYLAHVIPATWFLMIIRGIMLKGVGISELWPQALILTGLGVLLLVNAIKRFSMRLE
jgi:ABC-2 type transport system permease protein